MTKHCINHARAVYDCCRHCQGKDINCPEYLSEYERTRELVQKGLVEESYKDYCPYTKRLSIYWRIKNGN